jgi:hypothetical protein
VLMPPEFRAHRAWRDEASIRLEGRWVLAEAPLDFFKTGSKPAIASTMSGPESDTSKVGFTRLGRA